MKELGTNVTAATFLLGQLVLGPWPLQERHRRGCNTVPPSNRFAPLPTDAQRMEGVLDNSFPFSLLLHVLSEPSRQFESIRTGY